MRAHQIFPSCRERHRKPDKDVKDENLSFVAEAKYVSPSENNVEEWSSVAGDGLFSALKPDTFLIFPRGDSREMGRADRSGAESGMVCLHNHKSATGEIYVRLIAAPYVVAGKADNVRNLNICHAGEDEPMLDITSNTDISNGPVRSEYTFTWVASDLSTVSIKASFSWKPGGTGTNYGEYDVKLFIPATGRARIEATHIKSGQTFITQAPEGHAQGINDKAGPKEIRIFHRKGEPTSNHDLRIRRIGIGNKISGALP